jgi:hypothetical protein
MAATRTARRETADASRAGVWNSALTTAIACLALPTWVFGASAILLGPTQAAGDAGSFIVEGTLLGVGATAICCCALATILMRLAPALRDSPEGQWLKWGAMLAIAGVALFIQRALWAGGDPSTDSLALTGAVLPMLFVADLSRALSHVAGGRHGTDIGVRASYAWLLAAALLVVATIGPMHWWLPALVASAASAGSAVAGTRVWRRYEGVPVAN